MKVKYSFIDPGAMMGVIVALIILGVGVFAFFVVLEQVYNNMGTPVGQHANGTTYAQDTMINKSRTVLYNASNTGNSVFNIIGIVLIIGAIMSIVGLVYNYVR
jgi:hypothetical protein